MESQRSGILSTFIMTIPLVIVPALAIFRPPVPTSGFTSTDLGAADEAAPDDALSEFDLEPMPAPVGIPESEEADEEDADEHESEVSDRRSDSPRPGASSETNTSPPMKLTPAIPEHPSDPFSADGSSPETAPSDDPEPSEASETILVQQLNELGAMRTFWFAVPESETETGLAVFFRGEEDNIVYRFEAVGTTRESVLRSVHQQVSRWKMKNSGGRKVPRKTDPGE
jgi:hypothetical protein